ncbi:MULTISPECIES: hypothetical protein [unclassified Kribbella]
MLVITTDDGVPALKSGDNTNTLTTSGSWTVYDAIGVRQLP